MTQEAASFVIWKPERDGHAPPNWREGMKWGVGNLPPKDWRSDPSWGVDYVFTVPAEALNSPNDDASGDVDTWKRDEALKELTRLCQEADALDAISLVRKLPADFLAKHGITLAPENDWATELWADLMEAGDMKILERDIRKGKLRDYDQAAIDLIRERVVLKEGV